MDATSHGTACLKGMRVGPCYLLREQTTAPACGSTKLERPVVEYEARKVVWVLDAAVHSIAVEKGKELEHSSPGEEIFSAA
jgi:hypothetical protein